MEKTGVDALAVSVGTAHGVYTVKKPSINYEIIKKIKTLTPVYLVLHGGSGVPAEMLANSYEIEGGGISKVNIATDLELAFLNAVGLTQRMVNAQYASLPAQQLKVGLEAVSNVVEDKIKDYLHSDNKAW